MTEIYRDLKVKCVDSLEKVFADTEPTESRDRMTVLWGDTVSFQVAFFMESEKYSCGKVVVETFLPYHIRRVTPVPVNYPGPKDDDYLRTLPGMYPDLLEEIQNQRVIFIRDQWHSLWIDITADRGIKPGIYDIKVMLFNENDDNADRSLAGEITTSVEVIGAALPKLPIKHTEWFYADCLADYYNVEVFSDEHWRIVENFMRTAAKRRCNMILTPIFTPALDTYIGGERTTVQLVKISVTDGVYKFDFRDLHKWVKLVHDCGMEYFEISHLFTQWGLKAAPKITATVDGVEKRIFGWDTPALDGEYAEFLKIFLPELTRELTKLGIADKCYFHISDEPKNTMIEDYRRAKALVEPYLKGFHMMDATSVYTLYEEGLIEIPVCANNHIEEFLAHDIPELWVYYCSAQYKKVSNRFMAMPSSRNRVFGVQVYLFNMKGILHWGYNFYNSVKSRRHINPYCNTDADYCMPSGDAFLVYPGKDGIPEESIRLMVLDAAMADLSALYYLEELTDRKNVLNIIKEEAGMDITFDEYPRDPSFCLRLREKINTAIKNGINSKH